MYVVSRLIPCILILIDRLYYTRPHYPSPAIRIVVSCDAERYFAVDITGARDASYIRGRIFDKVSVRCNLRRKSTDRVPIVEYTGRRAVALLYLSVIDRDVRYRCRIIG